MRVALIAAMLMGIAGAGFADQRHAVPVPTVLGAHLGSLHSTGGWCDANPGLYARWSNSVQLGAYRNSECAWSAYVAKNWESKQWHGLRAAVAVGAVTGYRAQPVLPLVLPSVAMQLNERAALRLTYVPRIEKRGAHALHFMVEVAL